MACGQNHGSKVRSSVKPTRPKGSKNNGRKTKKRRKTY